jgi:hypothetical protein
MKNRLSGHVFLALLVVTSFTAFRAGAAAPAGRYTISNGSVYDTKTKLTWQQTPPTSTYGVGSGAAGYCSTLGVGWRVPKFKELFTIIDYSQAAAPLLDPTAFPSPQTSGSYLTSDGCTVALDGTGACSGEVLSGYVRCVK